MSLVILDRDGVINHALPHQVRTPEEWQPIPGSLDAVARLNRAGYRAVVATRQPGIRRRHLDFEDLNRIHERMHRQLADYGGAVEAVFVCLCLRGQSCECFRPRPSVLHEIAERAHVPLDRVPCISAAPEVLETAAEARARPIPIRAGGPAASPHDGPDPAGVEVHADLASAVETLLAGT